MDVTIFMSMKLSGLSFVRKTKIKDTLIPPALHSIIRGLSSYYTGNFLVLHFVKQCCTNAKLFV